MASLKSKIAAVVVLSARIMLPFGSVEPAPTKKKLAPPAPVKHTMRATTFDGPVGMPLSCTRRPPAAVQLTPGESAV